MSYLALYRKYRPKDFDEIVGQKAVVTTLRNQVRYHQLGHAYLFCGTRGTGKTSAAKVFAKAVNCLHPVDGNPCGECEMCREAEQGFNTIEIDAASNNGVDNIRDLREEVQYTPSKGQYKVYIIDEVHMLSVSAFNALLKTLEEPPEHVIFVLATTDPQKVLPTIISRCQRFDFKRLKVDELQQHLRHVCDMEGIQADEDALSYIAMMADGGCRDALSILDQCHAYYIHDTITLSRAQEVLGAVDESIFREMTESLIADDVAGLLKGIEKLFDDGRDPLQFVVSWNGYLRDLMVAGVLGDHAGETLHKEQKQVDELRDLASRATMGRLGSWIESLSGLEARMRGVLQRRVLMEVEMIRLVNSSSAGVSGGRNGSSLIGSVNGSSGNASGMTGAAVNTASGAQLVSGELKKIERRVERIEKNLREGIASVHGTPNGFAGERTAAASYSGNSLSDIENSGSDAGQNLRTASASEGNASGAGPSDAGFPGTVNRESARNSMISDEDLENVKAKWQQIVRNVADQDPGLMMLQKIRPEGSDEPGVLRLVSDQEIYLKMLSTPNNRKLRIIENAITDETGKRFRLVIGKSIAQSKGVSDETLSKINMEIHYTNEGGNNHG